MCSPMPDLVEVDAPLPCERYPECRQACTWPACVEPDVDTPGEVSGCTCVVCVMARANKRQAEMIKALTEERDAARAAVARVRSRSLGARFGIVRTSTIVALLDE